MNLTSDEVLGLSAEKWAARFSGEQSLEQARGAANLGLLFIQNHKTNGASKDAIERATAALNTGFETAEKKFLGEHGATPGNSKARSRPLGPHLAGAGFNLIVLAFIGLLSFALVAGFRYVKGPVGELPEGARGPTKGGAAPGSLPSGEPAPPLPDLTNEEGDGRMVDAEGGRRVGAYWTSKFSACGGTGATGYAQFTENLSAQRPGDLLYIEVEGLNYVPQMLPPSSEKNIHWEAYSYLEVSKIREYRKGKNGQPDGWGDYLAVKDFDGWSRKGPLVSYHDGVWSQGEEPVLNRQIAPADCAVIAKLDMRAPIQREADGQAERYWKQKFTECAPGRFYSRAGSYAFVEALEPQWTAVSMWMDDAQKLNGIEWEGRVEISVKGYRVFNGEKWGDYGSLPWAIREATITMKKQRGEWTTPTYQMPGGDERYLNSLQPVACADIAALPR